MSGKAPKDPNDQTCTQGSVDYDIITGKMKGQGSAENVDSLGNTMLGMEVKERFSSMRQAFLKMDCNRDGRITAVEVRNMCKQWNIPMSEAERVLDAADLDANGTMDFNEFAKRFDPDYDRPIDGDPLPMASSTAYGAIYDDRPIASSGWANFDDMEYSDQQAVAATKIQTLQRGKQARKEVNAKRSAKAGGGGAKAATTPARAAPSAPAEPATPAGSGSRAARSIQVQQLEQENGELKQENAELKQENGELKDRVAELEEENAALKKRIAELEGKLAASSSSAGMEKTKMPVEASARGGGGGAGATAAKSGKAVRMEEEEEPLQDIVVYGRQDDKKTQAVMAELKKNGLSFDAFDFDSTTDYMDALKASGFDTKNKVVPPVVVVRGKHAFWDEPDAAIKVHFPTMLINELRKLGLMGAVSEVEVAPRNVTMDVEIAERFHNMQQAFLKMDDNKDGHVSKEELRTMCKNWNIPQSEAERVIKEADFNASGNLDFREFARRFGR